MTSITVLSPRTLPFPRSYGIPAVDADTKLPLSVLDEPFGVAFIADGKRRLLCVLPGYECDGASLPWFARSLWNHDDPRTELAAWCHDALYETNGGLLPHPCVRLDGQRVSREEADELLAALMRLSGCSPLRCRLYLLAVRLFGARKWNSHRIEA